MEEFHVARKRIPISLGCMHSRLGTVVTRGNACASCNVSLPLPPKCFLYFSLYDLEDIIQAECSRMTGPLPHLLGIPREFRNNIYSLVFDGCVLKLENPSTKVVPECWGLMLANKQAHSEAINIYYRKLLIASAGVAPVANLAETLQPGYLQMVSKIRIEEPSVRSEFLELMNLDCDARRIACRCCLILRRFGVKVDDMTFEVVLTIRLSPEM